MKKNMNKLELVTKSYKSKTLLFYRLTFRNFFLQYKKIVIAFIFIAAFDNCIGQTKDVAPSLKNNVDLYFDIAPLFFSAPATTLGAGIEYNRFQLGVLAIRGNKLPDRKSVV